MVMTVSLNDYDVDGKPDAPRSDTNPSVLENWREVLSKRPVGEAPWWNMDCLCHSATVSDLSASRLEMVLSKR